MTTPNEIVARRLLKQAEWCQSLGSRLYSTVLRQSCRGCSCQRLCAGRFCMTITTIHPAQRLLCVFSGQSTASCCRARRRNLLPVIPRRVAIATVTPPGPGFTPLCNNRQQCSANSFIAQCRPMKQAAARPCWADLLRSCAALVSRCACWKSGLWPDSKDRLPTFGTNSAAEVAKDVAQRPNHEFLFFLSLLRFISCGGDPGSSCLDNVVR